MFGNSWCCWVHRKARRGLEDSLLRRLIYMAAVGGLVSLPLGVLQTTARDTASNISHRVRSKTESGESQCLSRPCLQSHTPSLLTNSIHLKWAMKSSRHMRKRKLVLISWGEDYRRSYLKSLHPPCYFPPWHSLPADITHFISWFIACLMPLDCNL